ncbi:DUF3108 domain-containing protein [Arcobacter sp. F2176]|uniref:DUF3108 domain-containing protein n=1 Tax=Arcobacter sp. F2176 TaxID=2044511 RepID=UPI00100B9995|nr:DUF3108 domain-containing protein [Arcobacter sp. F2176]RXJ82016.1 hypothetical protein CRU95_03780 [Arcobacter sp. F2176]
MNKIIIFIIFLSIFLNAKTFEATYKISYGIFGELGIAKTSLEILPNDTYKIKVHAYATGIAKFLSSNKEEYYESYGKIKNNLLIPNKYITISNNDYKKRKKTYLFDYKNKQILVKKYERKLNIRYDENLKKKESWEINESKEFTNFFATNDLLSLFFNITKVVPSFKKGNSYAFKAIGANKDNGKLDIIIPKNEAYKELQEALNTKNKKFIVSIHQKIFSSSNGELFISLNKEGFCDKVVLKDVLIFGDITGEMIKFKINKG